MQQVSEIKYHKSIHDLPLSKFIDCIVDNNLSALIISGFPEEEELRSAWENIIGQYTDTIGGMEYKMYTELFKEISVLKITLNQIDIAVGILQVTYDEFFAKEVNKLLRTDCKFNWKDQQSYQAECKKCLNRAKAIKIKLDLKNLQFDAIQKKQKPGAKIDRQYFLSILITLSDFAKYRLDETIKMGEYCERIKRFNEYCDMQKTK